MSTAAFSSNFASWYPVPLEKHNHSSLLWSKSDEIATHFEDVFWEKNCRTPGVNLDAPYRGHVGASRGHEFQEKMLRFLL